MNCAKHKKFNPFCRKCTEESLKEIAKRDPNWFKRKTKLIKPMIDVLVEE